nr:hypothetical protein CFP56_67387 [Quercus suber]
MLMYLSRNCTKHQVRCDYMETVSGESDDPQSPGQPVIVISPELESGVDLWQQTGSFPFPNLHVFPPPTVHEYTKNELRLLYHLSNTCNDLLLNGTTGTTVWTERIPKYVAFCLILLPQHHWLLMMELMRCSRFLSIASTYPYVMHALLAFAANHLTWISSQKETRNLYLHYGSIALRGLHEAIGSFSHANSDAVLASSLLLSWQTTDWRSWSSLRAGIQSVLSTMHSWKHESIFAEYISEDDLFASSLGAHQRRSSVDQAESRMILQSIIGPLQMLQLSLAGQEYELDRVNQLLTYLQQLQTLKFPQTPEQQFNNLYQLRKWLFWAPPALLQRQGGQGSALLTVAHYCAVALAVEPLFPDLGQAFLSGLALRSAECIFTIMNAMTEHGLNVASLELAPLMQFPRQAAMKYQNQLADPSPYTGADSSMFTVDPETFTYTTIGSISPAFAPSPLHYGSEHRTPSSSQSPYLEVPGNQSSYGYGAQTWGAAPSPSFSPHAFATQEEHDYDYADPSLGNFRGGFVAATPIWT